MDPRRSLLYIVVALLTAAQAGPQGCYKESVRKRNFSVNPGDYNPEVMTSALCMSLCGAYSYTLAAVTSGQFCYCGNDLPPLADKDTGSACNVPCAGQNSEMCGGMSRYVSVFTASKTISGLSLTSDAEGTIISVGTTVTLDVKIDTGNDVIYEFDYGDGSDITGPNITNMLTIAYHTPGEYTVIVYATDQQQPDQVAATTVRADAPPGLVEVECDPVFGTFEEGNCTCTVWWGSDLTLEVMVSSVTLSFSIEDPPLSLTGPAINEKTALPGDGSPFLYILHASEFSVSGKIIAWEILVTQTGTNPVVLLLQPLCPTSAYCYSSNTCTSSCTSTTSRAVTCPAAEQFCAQAATCQPNPGQPLSRYAPSNVGSYKVVQVIYLNETSVGYHYINEMTDIRVEPGQVLGLLQNVNQAVLNRMNCTAPECDLQLPYSDPSVGSVLSTLTASAITTRHAIRAIASGGSKVFLPLEFDKAGNFSLTTVAQSSTLAGNPSSLATTTILVLEGVNASLVTGPDFGATGEPIMFSVEDHTGNDVRYNWSASDGTVNLASLNQSNFFTFDTKGSYFVNATTYNAVSFKSNFTEIIIEDKLSGLSLTAGPTVTGAVSSIALTLTSGSSYTCTWEFGDQSTPVQTDETQTPLSGGSMTHTYLAAGSYDCLVTCSNNVSNISSHVTVQVEEIITNLRMLSQGAEKGQGFYLEWQVDAGTNITFSVLFDGQIFTDFSAVSTYHWKSALQPGRPPSIIPLSINASNVVSNASISLDFHILTVIVNPTLQASTVNTTSYQVVTFTTNMDAGSDVTVVVAFGDTEFSTHRLPQGGAWTGPVTFDHVYLNGGRFTVVANFTNPAGTYIKTLVVLVLVGVGAIECQLVDYAIYHPPAYVNLTFNASALPTEPQLTLNWGERQNQTLQVPLQLNTPYLHTYGDTGTYTVIANLSNVLGYKTCVKTITVLEKLSGPSFNQRFPAAAVDLPFSVTFCLYRGPSTPRCNLTYNFGDGSPDQVFERQGAGKDGCDTHNVTYTDTTPKIVTVTATTYLETVSANLSVDVIHGFSDSDIAVNSSGDVMLTSMTTFTVKFLNPTMPDQTKVQCIFGDNSQTPDSKPVDLTITSQGGTQQCSHTYSHDGRFDARIIVFNPACYVEKVIQVGVYQPYSGLMAQAYFQADIPPGAETWGLDGASKLFPSNKPIYLRVTDRNNAYTDAYETKVTNSKGDVILQTSFYTSQFSLQLNQSDTYTVDIMARNSLFNGTIPRIPFKVIELVQGLSVQEVKAQVRMNEPKVLMIDFIKVGTSTCLYVNFGDGFLTIFSDDLPNCTKPEFAAVPAADKHGLSGLTQISHVYTVENYYSVTITAENSYSSETQVVNFSISALDCSKPEVHIHNRHHYFTHPAIYSRSDWIQIQGLSNITCSQSYDNIKSWRLELINSSFDTVEEELTLAGLNTSRAELVFPPRYLMPGLYRLYFSMAMTGRYGSSKFESSIFTYIQVVTSPLICSILEGGVGHIDRGTSQIVTLRPLDNSRDPDRDPQEFQGLAVTNWTCENVNISSSGCNLIGFTSTGDTQKLTLGNLQPIPLPQTYRICVTIEKDIRSANSCIYLTVVQGNPPIVDVHPALGSVFYQLHEGYKILKSSRFAMDCMCSSCGPSDVPSYSWIISLFDYRWPTSYRPLQPEEIEGYVLGETTPQLAILSSFFQIFNSDHLLVECQVTVNKVAGRVSVDLRINSPAVPGTCTVSPANRTITTDKAWRLEVTGWSHPDGIAGYQFFSHTDDETLDKQITSVDTDLSSYTMDVCVSQGPDYNNFLQTVIVNVRDVVGGVMTFTCGPVVVRPMDVKDIRALTKDIYNNQLNYLERMFAEGDQKTCTETATSYASMLNSDSKQSQKEYAGLNPPSTSMNTMYGHMDDGRPPPGQQKVSEKDAVVQYQMESERNLRGEVREFLIDKVLELFPQTVTAVQQILSFLVEVTPYGDEIGQSSQVKITQSVLSMLTFLSDPANTQNVPPEDIDEAIRNAQAVLGCTMNAAGKNGNYGMLYELKEAQQTPAFFDYDSDLSGIGGPNDYSSADDLEDAIKMKIARVHRQRQAETARIVNENIIKAQDMMAKCFSDRSVPGESLVTSSAKTKQVIEKAFVEDISNKELCPPGCEGGVVLGNITWLPGLVTGDTCVASISQSTSHPMLYSDMAQAISSTSHFITFNLYTENGTKLSVNNLSEPIKVIIPQDATVKDPSYTQIDPMITTWNNLMHFVLYLNRTQSSIFMDFENVTSNSQFLLAITFGALTNIGADPALDRCDIVRLLPESMSQNLDDKNRYRFHLNNSVIGNYVGMVSIGVRQLNESEIDMDISQGCRSIPRYHNGSDYFTGSFDVRTYVTYCLSISDSATDWSNTGCVVGKETTPLQTVCYCYHLTTFAGGWVVVPNTIDWSYVFANADFLTNPTIYITVIVIGVLYIIFAFIARYKDKKMAEQLGIAPLADNDPRDKYFYELIVSTGMRRNAGTESQVCFILSGEDDETDVRAFSDSKRKIFRRGQIDGFLMAVPRPLGYLNFMRVWHDNSGSGKFGSWYLNYIIVRDIQTDVKQIFIANRWFAVEEDDGQVDRVIPVANLEQTADFSFQFGERSRKDFADGHLWFSVIARPAQSRFTCLQRVSCCLCLLYVTMLANAMFYNTTSQKETTSNSFSFGPFSIAPEQIFIGVVSNLIVFPVNFLLVYLFKKSRPHHKRPSRIDLAIKEVHDQNRQTNINDIKPEVSSIFSVSKTPCLPKMPHDPEPSASRPATAMSNTSTEELTPSKKKKNWELPWYFTIIAWVLLWVVTLGSLALVIFYGISFQDETCRKWITSMMVSFFMSVFVTQPIKVILFAVILSLIIKNPGEEKEDEAEDEELPHIDQDGELLHGTSSAIDMTRPRKIGYKPPDPQLLEKLREKRLKEIKMWAIIREVIVYAFFLWILMVISYRQLGASNFFYKDTLYKVFIANKQTDIDFFSIRNADEFWTWTTSGLVNGIRAGPYYNDYPPLKLRAYINDKVSRIMGYATMRQLRVQPGQCEIPDDMRTLIQECNVAYNMFDQEEGSFRVGWKPLQPGDSLNETRQEYIYKSAEELNGYPYWGTLAWYAGGGYVVPLEGSKDDLIAIMQQLQQEHWIDKYTRAVFVEFTVYNPQVNLFAISTILAEFHASGGMVASVRFEPAMLLPYMTSAMLFQIVCEIVYILFCLFFIIRELRELFKAKFGYFRSFWNLVEVGIIAMSISAIVIFFYRLVVTNVLTKIFKDTNGNGYVKFQYVAYWNEMFSYMIGFLCFLATLKFLKLLRFNRKMSMLSATLKFSAWSLIHFGIIFLIVFLAFSQLFYLTFMHIDVDYATFVASMVAGILMMMGKYDIYSMIMAEPVLTQIFVLLFVITVTFILVNMFVTILNETFSAVREDINKQGNDYEIINFMLQRFKQWTGLGNSEEDSPASGGPNDLNNSQGIIMAQNKTDHVGDFPERIERLLQTISSVYMDSDNLAQLYQKKPYESQSGNKNLLRTGLSPSPAQGYDQRRKGSSDIVARVHTH